MLQPKQYLQSLNQEELINFLAEVPIIRDYIHQKQENEIGFELSKKVPKELLTNYYLAETFEISKIVEMDIRNWCQENLEPIDMYQLLKYLKIPVGIKI